MSVPPLPAPRVVSTRAKRAIIFGTLAIAVIFASVMGVTRWRLGHHGVSHRIAREVANGVDAIVLPTIAPFDWDALYVFGPRAADDLLRTQADVPRTVALAVNLDARDDICLVVFLRGGRYRAHFSHRRADGDFAPAANRRYERAQARFAVQRQGGPPRLVPAAAPR